MQSGTRSYAGSIPTTSPTEQTDPLAKWQKLRQAGVDYIKLLLDYKYLLIAGAVLFSASAGMPLVPTGSEAMAFCNESMLCTHGTSPWGAATSVFLYDGWSNIVLYFIILVMYIAFSDRVDSGERRRRARFGSIAIFGIAMIANALWLHFVPMSYSWGSSGVVYALWGFLLAFTLFDGMPRNPKSLDPRTWYASKRERGSAMGNLMVFSLTAIMLVSGPSAFLSSGPGVNVFAHGVSFLGGYSAAHVYRWSKGRSLLAGNVDKEQHSGNSRTGGVR